VSGRFLLDTNIIVALLAGDGVIRKRLSAATEAAIPLPALGELYFGALKSARAAENLARIERLAAESIVLECDRSTAREYGLIKRTLRRMGSPIPENDIWIAAIARQHAMVLVTRDSHFGHIRELNTTRW
jgi:tRNA(fMet)-specific endonuclease VapC